uniref:Uncharacterized protein n=1 Tax=Triticum urartu TaxID=4572 RepID=A0A8R7UBZ3_TRIUA
MIWRRIHPLSSVASSCHGGGWSDGDARGSGFCRWVRSILAAADQVELRHPLAAGVPHHVVAPSGRMTAVYFLPAKERPGRQMHLLSRVRSGSKLLRWSCRPKWRVPGNGESTSRKKMLWTGLQFLVLV